MPLPLTLVARSLTGRRFGWRASAMPTSTPIGRRRTTSSPTPTRFTRCSSGSGLLTLKVTSRPCVASCTEPWRSTLLAISTCRRPASRATTASNSTTCLPMLETIRAALLDAFDRQRQVDLAARLVARHLQLGHSPQAADRYARACGATRRCRLPRLSDAGGGSSAVHRLGQHLTRADTSSLRSHAILRPIHRPNARRCRRPTSPVA